MATPVQLKIEAVAFQRVVRRSTNEVVGYRYRWNDGSVQILWCLGRVHDVIFVDLPPKETRDDTSSCGSL